MKLIKMIEDEMTEKTPIYQFRGEFAFLSNFFPSKIIYNGEEYFTAEHAFQAAKTNDLLWKKRIRETTSASKAKSMGRMVQLIPNWNQKRLGIMEDILRIKFADGTEMRKLLDMTKPRTLIEGNFWKDQYWGIYNGKGENWLGKLLMRIRDE